MKVRVQTKFWGATLLGSATCASLAVSENEKLLDQVVASPEKQCGNKKEKTHTHRHRQRHRHTHIHTHI